MRKIFKTRLARPLGLSLFLGLSLVLGPSLVPGLPCLLGLPYLPSPRLALFALLSFSPPSLPVARACEVVSRAMPLVYPQTAPLPQPVTVQLSLEQEMLHAHFEVRTPTVFAVPKLGPHQYPYQFDVVEAFVAVEKGASPYYEFELSPYDQTFSVKIPGGGKPMINGVDVGLVHHAQLIANGGGWNADLEIPLRRLGWKGDAAQITGNAFAVLGRDPQRGYWSLFLPAVAAKARVNFHQPEYFKPLVTCEN